MLKLMQWNCKQDDFFIHLLPPLLKYTASLGHENIIQFQIYEVNTIIDYD